MTERTLNGIITRIAELENQRDEILHTERGPWAYGLDLKEQDELVRLKALVGQGEES